MLVAAAPSSADSGNSRGFLGNVVWSAAQNWGGQLLQLGVFAVLARLLKPSEMGMAALLTVLVMLLQIFIDQGFGAAVIQRLEVSEEHLNTAFLTNLSFSLVIALLGACFARQLAFVLGNQNLSVYVLWTMPLLVINALGGVQQALLRRTLQFRDLAIRNLIGIAVGGAAGIFFALRGAGVWSIVIQQQATAVSGTILLWVFSKWRPGLKVSLKAFRDMAGYGANIVGLGILDFLNKRLDQYLIGWFLGPISLGYYSIAIRLQTSLTQLFTGTIVQVTTPMMSRIQTDRTALQQQFLHSIELTSVLAFPAFIGVSVLAPDLVPVMFGKGWEAAIPVMQVLPLIGILHSLFQVHGSVMLASGKPSWRLWLNCLHVGTNVLLYFIFARYGIFFVTMAYVIRAYLLSPLDVYLIWKLLRINLITYFKVLIVPTVSTSFMGASIILARHFLLAELHPTFRLAICICLGAVVYIVSVCLLSPERFREIFAKMSRRFNFQSKSPVS